ncbi:MAG: hypothetical protein OCD00_08765 [Colwellia sp.]
MRKILTMLCSLLTFNAAANTNDEAEIIGFDCANENSHMIEWLGLGEDYKKFVPKDIESELLKQQPDAKLIKLECKSEPELLTNALAQSNTDEKAIVTKFSATFFVEATIELGGSTWILSIEQNYTIKNMETTVNRQLTQNFDIKGSVQK